MAKSNLENEWKELSSLYGEGKPPDTQDDEKAPAFVRWAVNGAKLGAVIFGGIGLLNGGASFFLEPGFGALSWVASTAFSAAAGGAVTGFWGGVAGGAKDLLSFLRHPIALAKDIFRPLSKFLRKDDRYDEEERKTLAYNMLSGAARVGAIGAVAGLAAGPFLGLGAGILSPALLAQASGIFSLSTWTNLPALFSVTFTKVLPVLASTVGTTLLSGGAGAAAGAAVGGTLGLGVGATRKTVGGIKKLFSNVKKGAVWTATKARAIYRFLRPAQSNTPTPTPPTPPQTPPTPPPPAPPITPPSPQPSETVTPPSPPESTPTPSTESSTFPSPHGSGTTPSAPEKNGSKTPHAKK